MSQWEGNPAVLVRLEPHVLQLLRDKVGEGTTPGRGGGVAHYIRCLVYADLALPNPQPYAVQTAPKPRKRKKR